MNVDKPYIHMFKNSLGYYLFDVNTVKIAYYEKLKNEGYLSNQRVKESEHPLTEFLEDLINNKISHITLQVTQNCNLRCEYCIYSGEYKNRQHSNERMDVNTMRSSVDYLINHSSDAGKIAVEPLLEFDLIKKCVEYVDIEKAERILNVERETSEMCRNCWAYYFCTACISKLDDGTQISVSKLKERCNDMRNSAESELSDYIVMKELGYQFDLDS